MTCPGCGVLLEQGPDSVCEADCPRDAAFICAMVKWGYSEQQAGKYADEFWQKHGPKVEAEE